MQVWLGKLRHAVLIRTDLSGSDLFEANFENALFEPLPEHDPTLPQAARRGRCALYARRSKKDDRKNQRA